MFYSLPNIYFVKQSLVCGVNIYSQLKPSISYVWEVIEFQYWQKPKKTQLEWSLKLYLEAKKQAPTGVQISYPSAPECLDAL